MPHPHYVISDRNLEVPVDNGPNGPLPERRSAPVRMTGKAGRPLRCSLVTGQAAHDETAERLLATLREATGVPDLAFADEPTALTGGYYAELRRFRLHDPPPGLDGDLVARIVPIPATGEWEGHIQREVASQGFRTPAVRRLVTADSPLGRYLIVMDLVDGRPPMEGLGITSIGGSLPRLLRRLPNQLAEMAADLHALDPEPLAARLDQLDGGIPTTMAGFVRREVDKATAIDARELVAAGERVLATEPSSPVRMISHGDLHPFNLLIAEDGPVLIDWTVARIAHPGFTLAFTDLMLEHPPLTVPRGGTAALGAIGRRMARRFHRHYQDLAPRHALVSIDELAWHRRVHALRILVELAAWQAAGTPPPAGHPWTVLQPVVRAELGLPAERG